MKEKKLLDALNEIEDKFINEVRPGLKKKSKIIKIKWIAAVACFAILVSIAIPLSKAISSQFISEEETTVKTVGENTTETGEGITETVEEILSSEENVTEIFPEIGNQFETTVIEGICKPLEKDYWKKLDVNQQYSYIKFENDTYENTNTEILVSLLGKKIADTTAKGTDLYNQKTYTKDAEIFSIKTIDKTCAVAVKFEENNKYFVYTNPNCKFGTLGEIIEKLSLEENISISKSLYNLDDTPDYSAIKYKPIEKNAVFEKLLDDKQLPVFEEQYVVSTSNFVVHFTIDPIYPAYKITDCCFIVDPAGYLTVRVLNRDYYFFIGKKKANNFIDYVVMNYEGKRLVATTEQQVVYNGAITEQPVTVGTSESSTHR